MNKTTPVKETIGVIMGGCSSERAISFKTGRAIVAALQACGCGVLSLELDGHSEQEVLTLLHGNSVDVVFIALHGAFGEDGTLQGILQKHGICYTGSDAMASQLAMDKIFCQRLLEEKGLRVPPHISLSHRQKMADEKVAALLKQGAVVVKPAREGSSIGINIIRQPEQLPAALEQAFQCGEEILVERYIPGREITAGILGRQALPLVEIKPSQPFFDYQAKYQKGMTEYIVPADLPEAVTADVQRAALAAFDGLGCRDFGRADFIVDDKNQPYFLEMNTIPGFTSTSLLPMAARQAGFSFEDLCLKIVRLARERKPNPSRMF